MRRRQCTDKCSFEAYPNCPPYTELAANTEKETLGRKKKYKNFTNYSLVSFVSSTISYEQAVINFQMCVLN